MCIRDRQYIICFVNSVAGGRYWRKGATFWPKWNKLTLEVIPTIPRTHWPLSTTTQQFSEFTFYSQQIPVWQNNHTQSSVSLYSTAAFLHYSIIHKAPFLSVFFFYLISSGCRQWHSRLDMLATIYTYHNGDERCRWDTNCAPAWRTSLKKKKTPAL